ncbi:MULTISPECIES: hypothetical protein [unclassified Bradyrhizobium]|uniref:hypothetical protein n=1 Tax=unclassified Bradyrhizobium TaxID=2631580 RepID=UPI002915E1CA|nr:MULTISPECIES: hypothetical protein [unclassified Bradyrhizobium]
MTKKKRTSKATDLPMPPREGLIPGTWKLMDPSRLGGVVDRPRAPERWTPRHVGNRLIEAHRTLKRLPIKIRPASVKTAWPVFEQEPVDSDEDEHVKVDATAAEIELMEDAIGWPMRFLPAVFASAGDVNRWASQLKVEEFEKVEDGHHSVPWHELRAIADGLNRAGEAVR